MTAKKRLILFVVFVLFFSFTQNIGSGSYYNHKKPVEIKKEIKNKKEIKKQIKKNKVEKNIVKKQNNVKVLSYSNEEEWMSFEATFYNLCCNLTASGRKLEDGVTVAVDPRIIPLGTWIEIKYPDGNVERRRADDTGGVIKGRILDVYVAKPRNVLLQMGRQNVKVRILK